MKKAALILLVTIYALSSFGIGIKQFYCCGELEATNLTFIQQDVKKCGKQDEEGCCQTKYQFYKVSDQHAAAVDIISPTKQFTLLHVFTPIYTSLALVNQQLNDSANSSNAPPLHSGVPLFIFNCIYRV